VLQFYLLSSKIALHFKIFQAGVYFHEMAEFTKDKMIVEKRRPERTVEATFSSTEADILQYFMDISAEEQKKKHKKNMHRLNNIRYREKKQAEQQELRQRVYTLEMQLEQLKARIHGEKRREDRSRHMNNQNRFWKEFVTTEYKYRQDAQDENQLLKESIKQNNKLIKLYYNRIRNSVISNNAVCGWVLDTVYHSLHLNSLFCLGRY